MAVEASAVFRGGRSSMAERFPVEEDVVGSKPIAHPKPTELPTEL